MSQHTILWADDEIDLLKPHVMFLKNKGYDVVTVNNGADALALVQERHFDLIILDENMPGHTGDNDHQERRGKHNGPGSGQQDCRLSHKTGEP